ncbi:MAG: site-specific DNA-methyltransferase [Limnospira sp. PMC 1291.21]|uniref:site-specific DNA-methyltransferase n=1 Tax=unclassified Limnospira TaxID=2642885 RepID=UPI0028E0EA9D|nr:MULTISPECIES: site-specific DNA-methyltransferase [unclassified Limnospira]MDT9178177.1 site-specific DNA-methyltransferase [Limnospira sp. PMC 1238.20]MDT9191910.1 site-specific DNA-methyltransferase [Limnospira sp. PMC 1245.20]MDT9202124.1 site-specific DNA-methyltransferase [Limnospira sp. PMC 1243.20]MDT9208422.1 site-specific DNA-methyltransferase [Limnospira sp. PMC 1252.20]MDT9214080.1 site-specific DNA-methyltransferase [Limnospira sp. PMC 1256.20]
MPRKNTPKKLKEVQDYTHNKQHPQRPDIGTESQFQKPKPPVTYRYDSSLAPELNWDENPAREKAEALITKILNATSLEEAQAAALELKSMGEPFLNWSGKAERSSLEVPTLPLFVHERLSTRAIIETLKSHQKGDNQLNLFDLFNDPEWSITDQILRAYEYQGNWVNRMILGDSLITMNSLLQYEGMAGKVQMIYMDPPYGVKFGSNFQPFVKKRDVKHNEDEHFTREPEMVKAYRDTWELGLHSYLSYLRDRLLLARELLTESGSVFVQISDENVHHVREIMDEVFGAENFVANINFKTMMPLESGNIESVFDYICWYAKDSNSIKYRNIFVPKNVGIGTEFSFADVDNGKYRKLDKSEMLDFENTARENKIFKRSNLSSSGYTPSCTFPIVFDNQTFYPVKGKSWRTTQEGIERLKNKNRLFTLGNKLYYKLYLSDFGYTSLINSWQDTIEFGSRMYVVQTTSTVIQRCLLMTTDPSDLVLDITCGSGTTAYVAEQWGRRWITCDVSRVPLALARQRLLTATFPWYELKDGNSPSGGFVYKRKQNKKGEEVGGIVPHITLKSIANDEPPAEEILVDRPEVDNSIVRVCSPFTIEGTIPPPVDMENQEEPETEAVVIENHRSYEQRMLEILRKSPILHLPQNRTIRLYQVRETARSRNLSAEAMTQARDLEIAETSETEKAIAFLFGPENGAIAERTVFEAAREAHSKKYAHLFVIGFAISAIARQFVEHCQDTMSIPATYIQATPDLLMGDLLKHMKSSQIFSVCGLPEIKVHRTEDGKYQVELLGLDVFDPTTMEVESQPGKNVPAWFLDTDYNGLCFHVNQAFFPRTSAWEGIKKALKGTYDDEVWEHLAGTKSAPFEPGEYKEIAVKVIDDRGNELLVTEKI